MTTTHKNTTMTKSKLTTAAVRLFGGAGTPEAQRPTIDTPCGAIYVGTPEAIAYLDMKAWADPLIALPKTLGSMLFDRAQVVADIATLLPEIPASASRAIATLQDLAEALQGRLTSHSGMNFRDAGQAYEAHVVELRNHAERIAFNLDMLNHQAPRPPHPSQGPAQKRSPAGTWYSQHGDN